MNMTGRVNEDIEAPPARRAGWSHDWHAAQHDHEPNPRSTDREGRAADMAHRTDPQTTSALTGALCQHMSSLRAATRAGGCPGNASHPSPARGSPPAASPALLAARGSSRRPTRRSRRPSPRSWPKRHRCQRGHEHGWPTCSPSPPRGGDSPAEDGTPMREHHLNTINPAGTVSAAQGLTTRPLAGCARRQPAPHVHAAADAALDCYNPHYCLHYDPHYTASAVVNLAPSHPRNRRSTGLRPVLAAEVTGL